MELASTSGKVAKNFEKFLDDDFEEIQYVYFGKSKLTAPKTSTPKGSKRCKPKEYELWKKIQNSLGNAKAWPGKYRQLFWTKNLDYWDRLMLCTFVYINKLDHKMFFDWAKFKGLFQNQKAVDQAKRFLNIFNGGALPKLYGYNIKNKQYEWVNGGARF